MLIGLLVGLVLTATSPQASRPKTPEPTQECVAISISWSGSEIERQHIETTAVPDSLKQIWLGHDCQAWSLDHTSLLEWHLKFGTPQSAMEALNWVEMTALAGVESPQAFLRHAAKDLNAAKKGATADTDRANRDLRALDAYAFVAGQYLRAAEFFHSPDLLAKAKRYVDASQTGIDIFYPGVLVALQNGPNPFPNSFDPHYDINDKRELPLRYAIELAYQTGGRQDIAAAKKLLDQSPGGRDLMSQAAYQFMQTPKDPCDNGNDPKQALSPELTKACDTEQDLNHRVVRYWRDSAMLDLISARTVEPSDRVGFQSPAWVATALLNIQRDDSDGRLLYTKQDDELVEIYLASADAILSRARQHIHRDSPDCELCYAQDLNSAEAIVSPVANPNRFRQIAASYAQVCATSLNNGATLCSRYPSVARQDAYLDVVARHLGDIEKVESSLSELTPTSTNSIKP